MADLVKIRGVYRFVHRDRHGRIIAEGESPNTVMILGKNLMLDTLFLGSGYTHIGPYLGLISSIAGGGPASNGSDTMASHPGWIETAVGICATRGTPAFAASSNGASTPPGVVFNMLGTDNINGAFLVLGTGAVNTPASTAGVLLSAGTFAVQAVSNGNTLTVTYSLTLS